MRRLILAFTLILSLVPVTAYAQFKSPGAGATAAIIESFDRQEEQRRHEERERLAREELALRTELARAANAREERRLALREQQLAPPPIPPASAGLRFRCEWGEGTVASWSDGSLSLTQTSFGDNAVVVFDVVDPKTRTVQIIGSNGVTDGQLLTASPVLTIVEHTLSGVNVTTIYRHAVDETWVAAVHSRHLNIGGPLPSQFYGKCGMLVE